MPYNEILAQRVRDLLADQPVLSEKKMMGGLCFMVNEKMCVGVTHDDLMVRLGPVEHAEALKQPGCRPMDFTGTPLKGFVFVSPEGTEDHDALVHWITLALEYNPLAQASKKKKS